MGAGAGCPSSALSVVSIAPGDCFSLLLYLRGTSSLSDLICPERRNEALRLCSVERISDRSLGGGVLLLRGTRANRLLLKYHSMLFQGNFEILNFLVFHICLEVKL